MAGFLIPIWSFIILSGFNVLFNKESSIRNQKIFIFVGLIAGIVVTIMWDFAMPLIYIIRTIVQNGYGWLMFIETLKIWYLAPRFEFVQFLFDWAGILTAILFVKYFRKDLK